MPERTINGHAALSVVVTKPAGESTLARVVELVAEAETQKSPTQQFTDRFERYFVPIVLGLVILGLFLRDSSLTAEVEGAIEQLQSRGRTVMVVRMAERFLGVLGVMDTPRDNARAVIAELHRLGIEQTLMLTGDNQRVADAVAEQVGLRVARGDLLPEQKVAAIVEIARLKGGVAMVGDGVNDAPAMAHATVGIAMGAGGSDVALETADVALIADDLRALPFAIGLSREARSIIRQSLWASLGMVAFLIPATIFGFAQINEGLLLPCPVALVARMLGGAFEEAGAVIASATTPERARVQAERLLMTWMGALRPT